MDGEIEFCGVACEILITIICYVYTVVTCFKTLNIKFTCFNDNIHIIIISNRIAGTVIDCDVNFFTCRYNGVCSVNIFYSEINGNCIIKGNIIPVNRYVGACFMHSKISCSRVTCEIHITVICNIHTIITCTEFIIINRYTALFISEFRVRIIIKSFTSVFIDNTNDYITIRNAGASINIIQDVVNYYCLVERYIINIYSYVGMCF